MTVAIAGTRLQFAMPGDGWATVVSRSSMDANK